MTRDDRGIAREHRVHLVAPALFLGDFREEGVLDDEQAAVHRAKGLAELRELRDRHAAVVDDEAVVGVLDPRDDLVQNGNFFNTHFQSPPKLFGLDGRQHGNAHAHRRGDCH